MEKLASWERVASTSSTRAFSGRAISARYFLKKARHSFGVAARCAIFMVSTLGARFGNQTSYQFCDANAFLGTPRGGRRTVPMRGPSRSALALPNLTTRIAIFSLLPVSGHDAHAMSERGVDSSARRADDGFDTITIRVDDEGGVVVRTIVWPETRGAIVPGAVRDGSRVESVDGVSARRGEGQMETRARGSLRSRPLLYRELTTFAGLAVADLLGQALGRT